MSVDLSWWKDVPPILENTEDILKKYILEPKISIHNPEPDLLPRYSNIHRLFDVPSCSASTTIAPKRCPRSGKIIDFFEISILDSGCTSQNSMSLRRAPGPPEESTRGSAMNYPFWPGGFDEPEKTINDFKTEEFNFESDLLTIPPGFSNGIDFQDQVNIEEINEDFENSDSNKNITIDLLQLLEKENNILGLWKEEETEKQNNKEKQLTTVENLDESILKTIDNDSILKISNTNTTITLKTEWAEIIDISQPVSDFKKRIPNPAHTYPFELDTFQKQAILKLEEHNHVFVAAHTSAGKTVVAEYAIALSQKHMTRAIYTSPIKALSNQKYRDFKETFKDVGLITGDIQIDPNSSCLIMTTEILRSMLYCGSDVTRDLEYVIFDEVHYITDSDRGYVWEEVLILLPDHVSIVMLSATVPNTLEFANWVGRTKRRKVYVISTLKRPVPLKHYLYTGCGGKSKNEIFLIVDENSQFQPKGYDDAIKAKNSRKSEFQKNTHPGTGLNSKQEQTLWVGLIDFLKKNDKLPVIAFTLSRNRCDRNAEALKSCDLCTVKEKNLIHIFFSKCLQKLKPEDRILPQVKNLQDSLSRGIGIHHSGILPILKEIVEMLFQKGYVKLLFATETFAMGVNMPARTVIFDAATKFDGKESRMLHPAEYIQMAGRAGRRGLDDSGMVILICKTDVPFVEKLREMMLGKPMKLVSQFRLTYAMILNLLRVENVSVEDMMSRSFREFNLQIKKPDNKLKLQDVEKQISSMQTLHENLQPLCKFYDVAHAYITEYNNFIPKLILSNKVFKELKPGRVIKVSYKQHYCKLGVLLSTTTMNREPLFKVFVLDHKKNDGLDEKVNNKNYGTLWYRMLSLIPSKQNYIPEGVGGHAVIHITVTEILEISKTNIKLDYDKIIQNYEQRQIPRFKDSPPSQSVVKAIAELSELNNSVISGEVKLQFINLRKGVDIVKGELSTSFEKFDQLEVELERILPYTNISNFEHEFLCVFERKQLERKRDHFEYMLSNCSLTLYADYCSKLKVLEELKYIDEQQQVKMKGRVACEMGSNELLITELILSNILTELEPAEIAALLSSLVFQAKTDVSPVITDSLKVSIAEIENINMMVYNVEKKHKVEMYDDTQEKDRLNFGLVEVIFKWAKNKPFSEIMELTDVQEGIIVRCIVQLNETLKDVKNAARIIGNPGLQSKMEDAINAIKRDIVFAASLYTQKDTNIVI